MSVRSHGGSSKSSFFAKRQPRKQTLSVVVCGASGTGKSSFINTFFGRRVHEPPHLVAGAGLHMVPVTAELEEALDDGSRLVLTMIDCENYATSIAHADDVEQLAYYIECRFDEVLAEESRIRRNPKFKDSRVDACIYFIEPTGHGLREIDILTLRRLNAIVNIVPVLARADTLTPSERVAMKRMVLEDLRMHDIDIFDFRYDTEEIEEPLESEAAEAVPLAVTTASEFDSSGAVVYRRPLSYGVVNVLDPEHSDFVLLRDALLNTHRADLKERTHEVLYETYRTNRLDPQRNHRSSLLLPQELADHAARLKEAQLAREAETLREEERRVNAEIEAKRALLLRRERELRELEMRMAEVRPAQYAAVQQEQEPATEQRIRQSRSKRELKEHADQLHAEVASLEAQKQTLQERQLATAASSRSLTTEQDLGGYDEAVQTRSSVAPAAAPAAPVPSSSPYSVPSHQQTAAAPVATTPKDLHPRNNAGSTHVPEEALGSATDLADFVDVQEVPMPRPSTISEESLSFVQNTSPLQIKKMSMASE